MLSTDHPVSTLLTKLVDFWRRLAFRFSKAVRRNSQGKLTADRSIPPVLVSTSLRDGEGLPFVPLFLAPSELISPLQSGHARILFAVVGSKIVPQRIVDALSKQDAHSATATFFRDIGVSWRAAQHDESERRYLDFAITTLTQCGEQLENAALDEEPLVRLLASNDRAAARAAVFSARADLGWLSPILARLRPIKLTFPGFRRFLESQLKHLTTRWTDADFVRRIRPDLLRWHEAADRWEKAREFLDYYITEAEAAIESQSRSVHPQLRQGLLLIIADYMSIKHDAARSHDTETILRRLEGVAIDMESWWSDFVATGDEQSASDAEDIGDPLFTLFKDIREWLKRLKLKLDPRDIQSMKSDLVSKQYIKLVRHNHVDPGRFQKSQEEIEREEQRLALLGQAKEGLQTIVRELDELTTTSGLARTVENLLAFRAEKVRKAQERADRRAA